MCQKRKLNIALGFSMYDILTFSSGGGGDGGGVENTLIDHWYEAPALAFIIFCHCQPT